MTFASPEYFSINPVSRIRISIGNADPDPDPGEKKSTKIKK
jgi:hypothetical protein